MFRIKAYLKYRSKACHKRGFGIHSPFVFHLLNFVIFEKKSYYAYQPIENIRKKRLKDHRLIEIIDYGTGTTLQKAISDVAKKSLKRPKFAKLLFRLVNFCKAETILELGTSLGISTMYLASPNKKAQIYTLEGCPAFCNIAQKGFEQQNFRNIHLIEGNINETLEPLLDSLPSLDFVFFDANHRETATLDYFKMCLPKIHNHSIFVFDDIHHSKEMEHAWNIIRNRQEIRLSIDLFEMGLVFFNTDLPKQHYTVAF